MENKVMTIGEIVDIGKSHCLLRGVDVDGRGFLTAVRSVNTPSDGIVNWN